MTKYTARVTRVLKAGIHKLSTVTKDGTVGAVADLPLPDRVEIDVEAGTDGPCLMVRYGAFGKFCGDTWHQTLRDAFAQAAVEYGLSEADFSREEP